MCTVACWLHYYMGHVNSQVRYAGVKGVMAEDFRDSYVCGRCTLTAHITAHITIKTDNYKVSVFCLFVCFPQKASKVVGHLTAEFLEKRRINSITLQRHDGRKKNKRPIPSCCFSVQEEPDLNKAPLSKLPFLKYKVLTSCMVHFVVSHNFLEPCWG